MNTHDDDDADSPVLEYMEGGTSMAGVIIGVTLGVVAIAGFILWKFFPSSEQPLPDEPQPQTQPHTRRTPPEIIARDSKLMW